MVSKVIVATKRFEVIAATVRTKVIIAPMWTKVIVATTYANSVMKDATDRHGRARNVLFAYAKA
jgi:hypothetical protein